VVEGAGDLASSPLAQAVMDITAAATANPYPHPLNTDLRIQTCLPVQPNPASTPPARTPIQ
jgi:hypothetical protein